MIGKILKIIGKFVFGTLFSLMLVISLLIISLVNFTEFDNLNKFAGNLIGGQVTSQASSEEIKTGLQQLKEQCKNVDSINLDIGGQQLSFNCNDVNKADEKSVGSIISNQLLEKIYYQKYDCDFISCLTQNKTEGPQFMVLLSKKANDFFKQVQIYSWIVTAVFGAIFFFLIDGWSNRLKNFGITFVFVGIPFFLMNYVKDILIKSVPQEFSAVVNPLVDSLFKPVSQTYMIFLIVGAVLVATSFVIKYKFENIQNKQQQKK